MADFLLNGAGGAQVLSTAAIATTAKMTINVTPANATILPALPGDPLNLVLSDGASLTALGTQIFSAAGSSIRAQNVTYLIGTTKTGLIVSSIPAGFALEISF